jgi:hypothetical protein
MWLKYFMCLAVSIRNGLWKYDIKMNLKKKVRDEWNGLAFFRIWTIGGLLCKCY